MEDFTRAFGTPTATSAGINRYQTTINGTRVLLIALTYNEAPTPNSRVEEIVVRPPQGSSITWTEAQSEAMGQAFLPHDAHYVTYRDRHSENGTFKERIYTSAQLAASFPADAFFDNNGSGAVAPGTCHYQWGSAVGSDGAVVVWLGA